MAKKILYLDQNYASELAKTRYFDNWNNTDKPYYESLLSLIERLTSGNQLVCPISPSHEDESERGHRIQEPVWRLFQDLSHGVRFKSFIEIFMSQVEEAAYEYVGLPHGVPSDWQLAFNTDPNSWLFPGSGQLAVKLFHSDEYVDHGRKTVGLTQDTYLEFKQARMAQFKTYADCLRTMKTQLLYETFFVHITANTGMPGLDQLQNILGNVALLEHKRPIFDVLSKSANPAGFWECERLLESPFLHIRASLMAADIFFYPKKAPDRGLNTDFDIIASILPYVDYFATDRYVKNLMVQAKIHERFDAQVFSLSVKDRNELMEMLAKMEGGAQSGE